VAVVGVPDEEKGEAIVLLAAVPVEPAELRQALLAAGVPNLWIPRRIVAVEKIPVLATGKLDLKGCAELVREVAVA